MFLDEESQSRSHNDVEKTKKVGLLIYLAADNDFLDSLEEQDDYCYHVDKESSLRYGLNNVGG